METFLSVAVGLCLAAACGFRVFLPLLGLSLAGHSGQVPIAAPFDSLATMPAIIALATASLAEITAYYIPWFDHALDALATPAALVAGVLATGAVTGDLPPVLRWAIALIAGGGTAGLMQGATVLLRLKSSALTGGLGNGAIATAEVVGATTLILLAIVVPLLGLLVAALLVWWAGRRLGRIVFGRAGAPRAKPTGA